MAAQELRKIALAEVQVPNIITRDAVRGLYEWCHRHNLIDDHIYAKVQPPYDSAPPAPEEPRTEEQLRSVYGREMHQGDYMSLFWSLFGNFGDFGNYVIKPELARFSRHQLSSARPRRMGWEESYPAELGQSWVFERVLSLGWTPEAFASFDESAVRKAAGHAAPKEERFGKKYQWIALSELIARIADNFHLQVYSDGEPATYAGPWQSFGRDIDPTLPPPSRKGNEDGKFELGPTFAPDADDKLWWTPPGSRYCSDDPPVDKKWAVEVDDIPELAQIVKRNDNATPWVVLRYFYLFDDKDPEYEGKDSWNSRHLFRQVYSWLVQPAEREALVKLLERQSSRELPISTREHTSAAYLGELPWAVAANYFPDGEVQSIYDDDDVNRRKFKVYPAWEEYNWETTFDHDNHLDGVEKAWLPALPLFKAGQLNWVPGTRKWRGPDGSPVAQYREGDGHSALLVREDWLQRTLEKTGHSIVFACLGKKQLVERLYSSHILPNRLYDWTETYATASLADDRWTFGKRRLERHQGSRE